MKVPSFNYALALQGIIYLHLLAIDQENVQVFVSSNNNNTNNINN
jgi:hypothetical protein